MKKSKKRKGMDFSNMRCPYCGGRAQLRNADGIYKDNSRGMMLYVCENYPECDTYVRTHAGTCVPVGSMANQELRKLRRTAHHYFDRLHTSGLMSREEAYQWLANEISAPLSEAHIGHLGEYYCKEVIRKSKEMLERQKQRKKLQRLRRRDRFMRLTEEQKLKVEANMGLVGKVIADKVHGTNQYRIYSYEDLYQIGCIGLCKAAVTDKGGCFTTYAYRIIWNEICDALVYSNVRTKREILTDRDMAGHSARVRVTYPEKRGAVEAFLIHAKRKVCPSTQKGIDAILLKEQGYSGKEIGEKYGVSERLVAAWISRARKYLQSCPQLQQQI